MKPTQWTGRNDTEFGPNLELGFGDFHQISIDNDGMDFVMFSRNGFIVWDKKLTWQELFAVVHAEAVQTGDDHHKEES